MGRRVCGDEATAESNVHRRHVGWWYPWLRRLGTQMPSTPYQQPLDGFSQDGPVHGTSPRLVADIANASAMAAGHDRFFSAIDPKSIATSLT